MDATADRPTEAAAPEPGGRGVGADGANRDVTIAVVLAPAVGRIAVDPLTGVVNVDERGAVMSAADAAALETALQVGETWDVPVTAWSAGGALAESVLRDAQAVGVTRAVRVELDDGATPAVLAAVLAEALRETGVPFVVAGVHGADIGSAAVPAFLAHHLGASQALGLIDVQPGTVGRCEVVRRLDRGARERLAVAAPAVISVEGSVARLRRAGLRSLLASGDVEVVSPPMAASGRATAAQDLSPRPWRPRAQVVPGPSGDSALDRIRDLTGIGGPSRQSRSIQADPAEAAEAILDQLGEWGYGPRAASE